MEEGGLVWLCEEGRGSVMLWAMFYWKTLCPGIQVDVKLTYTTYLNIAVDQVPPFITMVLPNGSTLEKIFRNSLRTWQSAQDVELASKCPRSQSIWVSVGCAQQISPIHCIVSEVLGWMWQLQFCVHTPAQILHVKHHHVKFRHEISRHCDWQESRLLRKREKTVGM